MGWAVKFRERVTREGVSMAGDAVEEEGCQVEAVVAKRLRALRKRLEKGKKIREAKEEGREINEQQEVTS